MSKSVTAVLREIALVRSSKDLTQQQKDVCVAKLKASLDELTGQLELPGVPPTPIKKGG